MPRSLWLLVIGTIINVTASSFLWPLNTIYIHDQLGKSLTVAGFVLMLNAGASVVGNLAGGVLFDKIGGYKSILTGIIITTLALAGLIFNHEWPAYIVFLTIIGFGTGIVFPATYAMAGTVWPEGGRKAFNAVYVAQNFGVALGSALGGIVASYSFELIFIANGLLYAVFYLVVFFGFRNIAGETINPAAVIQSSVPEKSRSKLFALSFIASGYLLCWVAYVQWQSTIAAHTQNLHISLSQYSLLWTINGALIVLAQPLVSWFVKFAAKTLKHQMVIGIVIFIISFIAAAQASEFTGFLVAMVILTFGEMLVWPAVPTIANSLAPKGREGFYQGFINSNATGGRMIGPLLGGMLADYFNMTVLFGVLIGLLIAGMVFTFLCDKHLKKGKEDAKSIAVGS
ncbi:MDR family MFS transporter [Metabacillus sp. RGM 3146]|uniref:MDR family MFS transporter n=1 Tax=Metabacillus sp. RGM 3146 TaxID=3401092 RepID=UPI003B9AB2F4